jgi:hypothetical protein
MSTDDRNSFEPDEGEEEADGRTTGRTARASAVPQADILKMHESSASPRQWTLMTSFTAPGDHHGAFESGSIGYAIDWN